MKVLFIYPNTYGMNMLPPAIAMFSAILKNEGHQVQIFDTTYYAIDYGIDSDGTKVERLNVMPFKMEEKGLRLKTSDWKLDLKKQVNDFKPDLFAISSTEDMWELAMQVLQELKDYKIKNNIPVVAGGVFATFAPEICIKDELVDLVCVGEGENALIDLCNKKKHPDYCLCRDITKSKYLKSYLVSNIGIKVPEFVNIPITLSFLIIVLFL